MQVQAKEKKEKEKQPSIDRDGKRRERIEQMRHEAKPNANDRKWLASVDEDAYEQIQNGKKPLNKHEAEIDERAKSAQSIRSNQEETIFVWKKNDLQLCQVKESDLAHCGRGDNKKRWTKKNSKVANVKWIEN